MTTKNTWRTRVAYLSVAGLMGWPLLGPAASFEGADAPTAGSDIQQDSTRYSLSSRYALEISRTIEPSSAHASTLGAGNIGMAGDRVSELAGRLGFVQTYGSTRIIPYIGVGQRVHPEHRDYDLAPGFEDPGRYLYAPLGLDLVSGADPASSSWSWSARAEYDHVFDLHGEPADTTWASAPGGMGDSGYGFRVSATLRQGMGERSLLKGIHYTPYFEYWRMDVREEEALNAAGDAALGAAGSETWGFRITAEF